MSDRSRGTVLVVGAGIVGSASALELLERGWAVTLVDPGPIPRPEASSTDRSKIVRMDYGADDFLSGLADEAIHRWHRWNGELFDRPLYHQVGFLLLSRDTLRPGSFEGDSWSHLRRAGHRLERLDTAEMTRSWPGFSSDHVVDGYFNPRAGWAESGEVVRQLVRKAESRGAVLRRERVVELDPRRDSGWVVVTGSGEELPADGVVLAAGAWSASELPALLGIDLGFEATAMPVFHFRPDDPTPFLAPRLPVWAADIARTGWYGFPAGTDGVVKVANHGRGMPGDPDSPGTPSPEWEVRARDFLSGWLPALADAPLVGQRHCFYCDSPDGDLWICPVPDRPGVVLATGGSGHAFKFGPVLGELVANALEARDDPRLRRFRWRPEAESAREQARAD